MLYSRLLKPSDSLRAFFKGVLSVVTSYLVLNDVRTITGSPPPRRLAQTQCPLADEVPKVAE